MKLTAKKKKTAKKKSGNDTCVRTDMLYDTCQQGSTEHMLADRKKEGGREITLVG